MLPLGECQPERPVPLISFHGTADATIPYAGRQADRRGNTHCMFSLSRLNKLCIILIGPIDALPHIQQYLEEWAIRNGCASRAPSRTAHVHHSTQMSYWYCDVEGYAVGGLGHSWPTRGGLDHGGATDFDATPEHIIPFFNKYTLPS
jgi:polyhydroxybutyrate depolymerase